MLLEMSPVGRVDLDGGLALGIELLPVESEACPALRGAGSRVRAVVQVAPRACCTSPRVYRVSFGRGEDRPYQQEDEHPHACQCEIV